MSEAEELALSAFPPVMIGEGKMAYDANEEVRKVFLQGYEFGKAGWITWRDVKTFVDITMEIHNEFDEYYDPREAFYERFSNDKEFYEEVMQRYVNRKLHKR